MTSRGKNIGQKDISRGKARATSNQAVYSVGVFDQLRKGRIQSGVALRLPPHSKGLRFLSGRGMVGKKRSGVTMEVGRS
jgi:hypothetical protein